MTFNISQRKTIKHWATGLFAWLVALTLFFPILWMIMTSFKTELQAISQPPLLFWEATFDNYILIQERSDYLKYALNSL